jgi:hypothetical protein
VLVAATQAIRLCRGAGYEAVPGRNAVAWFDRADRWQMVQIRDFIAHAGLTSSLPIGLGDENLLARLRIHIRSGNLVVVRESDGAGRGENDSLVKQRRLVRSIDAKTRGRLTYAGRQYRLVADATLHRLSNRNSYEVVGRRNAVAVLHGIAGQGALGGGDLAKLLHEAADMLTRDWRPPLAPNGLVLLRRIVVQQAMADLGPAITPSQMKKLANSDWIEVEVVDQDDNPFPVHYKLELTNPDVKEGELDGGFVGVYDIPSGKCTLTIGAPQRPAEPGEEEEVRKKAFVLPITEAHFRTGSAVMLPEGEAPTTTEGTAISSTGALAIALRFSRDRPYQTTLVAGHTDSVGGNQDNKKLSQQRAEVVYALLTGAKDKFVAIANATDKPSDWKQILRWASVALASLPVPEGNPEPAFSFADCDPGTIDDDAATGKAPLEAFQRAYNANRELIGAPKEQIGVDGAMGKETWGAVFECYQFNMAQELCEVERPEDEEDPAALRAGLANLQASFEEHLLMPDKPFIGFGEKFPASGLYVDNQESMTDRRTEILFFDEGEEPDVDVLKSSPENTELYSPDDFDRVCLHADNAHRGAFAVATVYARIDVFGPSTENSRQKLHLTSPAASFDATRALADCKDTGDGYIDVVFQKVPKNQSYDLALIDDEGAAHPIFTNVPFDDLDEWTDTQAEPPDDDPLAPEPEDTT